MNKETFYLLMGLVTGKCVHLGAGFVNTTFDRTNSKFSDDWKKQLYERLKQRTDG